MGHLLTQTNPFPQGGTQGPVTTYQYDLLSRNTLVTLPGGNTVQTAYTSSSIVTVTDQVNRKIKRESDGLGRLIKVTEQDVSTGSLTQETTYTYDGRDHLIGVNQGGQTRAFKYDSEGHLLFERIPEMTATINDGTGTMWSCKYTYTSFGAVATKQDARGVITTYGYDSVNRVTSISYNTSGASGVATTPNVTYNYDNNQASSTKGRLLSLSVGSGYSETYNYSVGQGNGGNGGNQLSLTSVTKVMDGHSYQTSYQYNTANQLTQLTYPSARVIALGHDSKGRVTSIGSFLSSLTYNGIGQVTGTTLGNGASESYGYDANRMQLTSQTATQSGGSTGGLMNLTYGYQASAGQMGAGSTAGNAGQLMTISGTIGGVTESAGYTYDDLGRLVTSNQTSNTASAQRRFAYDRWGNRTGVWDATSGGTQIQSVTLQQSGGTPTNRIASVTSGTTLNYTYDGSGNVTNDGVHTYQYDAENRIVNVDGGTTASSAYDQRNRRYEKTVGSSVTHYVWQESQVLAEHNGNTGAVLSDYVYSGNRMIAKVSSGTTQYFLSDRLSERLALDTSGNVSGRQAHLPFGEDFGESGTQEKHRFTSYERDGESGVDYAINRGDSNAVGRFMQVDTNAPDMKNLLTLGSAGDPQSLNRYAYGRNDPVNGMDPLGLQTCFGYNVFLTTIGADGTQIGKSVYLGFLVSYCIADSLGPNKSIALPTNTKQLRSNLQLIGALYNLGTGCKSFFGGMDTLKGLARDIANGNGITVSRWDSGDPILNDPAQRTITQFWFQYQSGPIAPVAATVRLCVNGRCSNQIANQIILGPAFFNPAIFDPYGLAAVNGDLQRYQRDTLIHEYMHVLNDAGDEALAAKWGLADKGYGTSDPSGAISAFFVNDCGNKQ